VCVSTTPRSLWPETGALMAMVGGGVDILSSVLVRT